MKKIVSCFLIFCMIFSSYIYVSANNVIGEADELTSQDIEISAVCDKTGNCFIEGETVVFDVRFENRTNNTMKVLIETNAESSYRTIYRYKTINEEFKPNSTIVKQIKFNIKEKNTYKLHISLKTEYGIEFQSYEVPFSYVERVKSYDGDNIFGVCSNLGWLKNEELTSECEMLAKSGIQYVRDNLYWNEVEIEKGQYTFYGDEFTDELIQNGIKPIICLGYGNKYYLNKADVPTDEAGYQGFANYAAAIAEHYKGEVIGYEIWNEWNGGTWSTGGTNENYIEILKHAYKSIKEKDPNAVVLCGGAITEAYGWFEELYKLGALDYCDAISYHPYCLPTDPDQKSYRGNIEDNFETEYQIMKKYGTPKPQWYTEYGWYTGTDGSNVDEKTQADYMVRSYASGMAYGVEKIFMYTFKDVGNQLNYSEHNYGIIKNSTDAAKVRYAPKQSYIAIAAATNKLKGAKFVKEYRPLSDARVFQYEKDGKDVVVMYYIKENETSVSSINASIKGNTAQMKMYDIFGNEIKGIDILDGSPIYLEGEKGLFNINDICISKRNSALITFGRWKTQDGIYVSEHHLNDTKGGEDCFTIGKGCEFDNIVCDVDDGYICGGNNDIAIDIRYFDYGSSSFYLEYTASDGIIKKTSSIKQSKTYSWKTTRIYINDAAFDNSLDGKDFEIKIENPFDNAISFYGVQIIKTEDIDKRVMSVSFDNDRQFADLPNTNIYYYPIMGDGCQAYLADKNSPFEYTMCNGRKGINVTAQGNALFVLVDAADDVLYGNFYPVKVSVDYFDEGTGKFTVAYDTGNYTNFGESSFVTLGDTKTWKTAEFTLSKCWWQNHENSLSDISVQLWAPRMGTSTEGIVFGGITLEVLDNSPEKEKPLKAIINKINAKPSELSDIVKENFEVLNISSRVYKAADENNLLEKGFEFCKKDIPYNTVKNEDITEFRNSIKQGMMIAVFNAVNESKTLVEVIDDSYDILKLERESIDKYWRNLSIDQKIKICDNMKKDGYDCIDDIKYELIENIILYQLLNISDTTLIADTAKTFIDLYETKIESLSNIDFCIYDELDSEKQLQAINELKEKSNIIKTLTEWKDEFNAICLKLQITPSPSQIVIENIKFADKDGNYINNILKAGDTLNVSAYVINYDESVSISMIVVVYNEEGRLVDIGIKKEKIMNGQETPIDVSVDLQNFSVKSGYTARVYFWNDIVGMYPLQETAGI